LGFDLRFDSNFRDSIWKSQISVFQFRRPVLRGCFRQCMAIIRARRASLSARTVEALLLRMQSNADRCWDIWYDLAILLLLSMH